MNDLFSLNNKNILITGGTRGIGRAITLRFSREGALVNAIYVRNDEAARELEKIASQESLSINIYRTDITSQKDLGKLMSLLGENDKKIDALVHCAATGIHRPFEELSSRHFDWVFSLNIRAFFELVKMLMPKFSEMASIVAISSQGAVRAIPSYSLIGATKGALEAFSRHLAAEFAPKGIRVNILSPGSILTESWEVMPDREKRIEETISRTPIKRLVTADEVALAAQFLCSDASAGIVGHTLVIDGGAGIVA